MSLADSGGQNREDDAIRGKTEIIIPHTNWETWIYETPMDWSRRRTV